MRAALRLLGAHVVQGANYRAGLGGQPGLAVHKRLCDTEVNYLYGGNVVLPDDEKVRRLDVSVNDSSLMCVLNCAAD